MGRRCVVYILVMIVAGTHVRRRRRRRRRDGYTIYIYIYTFTHSHTRVRARTHRRGLNIDVLLIIKILIRTSHNVYYNIILYGRRNVYTVYLTNIYILYYNICSLNEMEYYLYKHARWTVYKHSFTSVTFGVVTFSKLQTTGTTVAHARLRLGIQYLPYTICYVFCHCEDAMLSLGTKNRILSNPMRMQDRTRP